MERERGEGEGEGEQAEPLLCNIAGAGDNPGAGVDALKAMCAAGH